MTNNHEVKQYNLLTRLASFRRKRLSGGHCFPNSPFLRNGAKLRRVCQNTILLMLYCLLLSALFTPLFAEEEQEPKDRESSPSLVLPFRYWMVPADRIEEWPWGNQKYYPIKGEFFDQWIDEFERRQAKVQPLFPIGQVKDIRLSGRLEGETLVDGTGVMLLSIPDKVTDSIPFSPVSFACTNFYWSQGRVADVSLYPETELHIRGPLEDELSFSWSQRGEIDRQGNIVFDLDLGSAPASQLTLEIPAEYIPQSSVGIVQQVESNSLTSKKWTFHFGGHRQLRLTMLPVGLNTSIQQKNGYQQEISYRVSLEGIVVTSRFIFVRPETPFSDLTITLDHPLTLTAIEWEGSRQPMMIRSQSSDNQSVQVTIPFVDQKEGASVIRVSAFCSLPQHFKGCLPSVRLFSERIHWKETLCRLTVERPLLATEFALNKAVLSFDPLLTTQTSGRSWLFKYLMVDGSISLSTTELQPRVQFDSATELLYMPGEISATTQLRFQIEGEGGTSLEFPLSAGWEVEVIQSDSGEEVIWEYLPRLNVHSERAVQSGEAPAAQESIPEKESRIIRLSVKKQRKEEFVLSFQMTTRYVQSIEENFLVDSLSPLALEEVISGNHFLLLRSEPPYQVRLMGREGISPESISAIPKELSLQDFFSDPTAGALIALGNDSLGVTALLEKTTPDYSATLLGKMTLDENFLIRKWRIRCVPALGSRIDRVIVACNQPFSSKVIFAPIHSQDSQEPYFKEDAGGTPAFPVGFENRPIDIDTFTENQWALVGEENRAFQLVTLSADDIALLGLPEHVDARELRFHTSRTVPFEIEITKTFRLASLNSDHIGISMEIPLVFLPEIKSQMGEIVVESPVIPVEIAVGGMTKIPVSPAATNEQETVVGSYRYDPHRLHQILSKEEISDIFFRLTCPNNVKSGSESAWCWFHRFDSLYDSKGIVRNHSFFYIENWGRNRSVFRLPENVDFSAIHAVWVNGERVTWYPERLNQTNAIRIALPPRRRFLSVFIEYYMQEEPLQKRLDLAPKAPTPDMPVLAGVWNLWLPPEWRAESRLEGDSRNNDNPVAEFLQAEKAEKIKEKAHFLLDQLGNETLLRQLATEHKQQQEGEAGTLGSASSNLAILRTNDNQVETLLSHRSIGPTWGDVFTDRTFVSQLFSDNEEKDFPAIYMDRFSLGKAGVLPNQPIVWPESSTERGKGLGTLEQAGLVLLFVDARTIYVTSSTFVVGNRQALVPLVGDRIWFSRDRMFAERLLASFVKGTNPDTVSASYWKTEQTGFSSPWKMTIRRSRLLSESPRWNTYEFPLTNHIKVKVVNRYRLMAEKYVLLILVLCLTIRIPRQGSWIPFILVVLIGLSGAIRPLIPASASYCLEGILFGAILSLTIYLIRLSRHRIPDISHPSSQQKTTILLEQEESSAPGFVAVVRAPRLSQDVSAGASTMITTSSNAPEVLSKNVSSKNEEPSSHTSPSSEAAMKELKLRPYHPSENGKEKENGFIRLVLLMILAILLSPSFVLFCRGQGGNLSPVPDVRPSLSSPKEQSSMSPTSSEPYRVFVPVDDSLQPKTDGYYWIPEELHHRLKNAIYQDQSTNNQWSITEARYVGAVNYNSSTGALSLFHLKATYRVRLESTQARIEFPLMPILPDGGAKFDRLPIVPLYEEGGTRDSKLNSDPLTKSNRTGSLSESFSGGLIFEINNSTPGEHLLELSLTMPQFGNEPTVSIIIPPVLNAFLELSVPPDAPRIKVLEAHGSVSFTGGKILAALGATNHLTLQKMEESGKTGGTLVDVEQLFRLHARSNQTDLHAKFIFRISGGKVKTLYLQNDPRYVFSGQCTCNEAEIESIELDESIDELVRIVFKRPISGTIVLNANYVTQGFSGVGQIRFPQIKAVQARIIRHWMGLSETSTVEYVNLPPSDFSLGLFRSLWPDSDNVSLLATYDLLRPNPVNLVSIGLKQEKVEAVERIAYAFSPKLVYVDYQVELSGLRNFQYCSIRTDKSFIPDSVSVFDDQGNLLESPEYFQSEGTLFLFFRTPLRGKSFIHLAGKTRMMIGQDLEIPDFTCLDIPEKSKRIRLFRLPSVYLQTSLPLVKLGHTSTVPRETEFFQKMIPAPLLVGDYLPNTTEDEPLVSPLRVTTHYNLPRLSGTQETILFLQQNRTWEAGVHFNLDISNGEVEELELELDELCIGLPRIEPSTEWQVLSSERKRMVRLKPSTPLREKITFQLFVPLSGNAETLRLPKISILDIDARKTKSLSQEEGVLPANVGTLPSPAIYRTVPLRAVIEKTILLPLRDPNNIQPLVWETEGLSPQSEQESSTSSLPASTSVDFSVSLPHSTSRSAATSLLSASSPALSVPTELMTTITQLSGMIKGDFQRYKVLRSDYSASISVGRNIPVVIGAEYYFHLQSNGAIYGTATLDLRGLRQNRCVLVLPPGYRLLEVAVEGLGLAATVESEDKVSLELVPERYSQRIEIFFSAPARRERNDEEQGSLGFDIHSLRLPRLENIEIEKLYWGCSYEYSSRKSFLNTGPFLVHQFNATDESTVFWPNRLDRPPYDSELLLQSDWRTPIEFEETPPIFLSLNYDKMLHLLRLFELESGSFGQNESDLQRWYSRWLLRWWACRNDVEFFLLPSLNITNLNTRQKTSIFRRIQQSTHSTDSPAIPSNENLVALTGLTKENAGQLRAITPRDFTTLFAAEQKLLDTYQLRKTHDAMLPRKQDTISSFGLWRLHCSSNTRFLFGVTNEDMTQINLFVPKKQLALSSDAIQQIITWLVTMAVTLFLMGRKKYHTFLCRYIHLFGIVLGLFWYWCLTPAIVGGVIILVAFWLKYRLFIHFGRKTPLNR